MSSDESKSQERPWLRMIQKRQQKVEALVDECKRASQQRRLTPQLKRELAVEVEGLHRQLERYADEPVFEESNLPDISDIKERSTRQVSVVETKSSIGGGLDAKKVPAIDGLSIEYLLRAANEVENTAKKLGFWASLSQSPTGGSKLPHPNNLSDGGPESAEQNTEAADFEGSHFFRSLHKDVEGNRGGGAIVIVDAEDARTGVGKTGAACAMAEYVAWYFGYELKERDGVLSGQEYLDLFKKHPNEEQVSVAVWDEAVGAGSGDSRRAMAQENVDLGRAWQIMRDRRVITFVTLPDWGDLDSRLQKLADYRMWCRRDIGSIQAYEIGTTFEGGDIRTRGLGPGDGAEPISFPDVTDDSELYQAIKAKKDEVQESDSLDAGELLEEENEGQEGEQTADVHEIADKVADSVEQYVSVNPTNDNKYLDQDLIEADPAWELTEKQAKQVRKLANKKVGEI